MLAFKSGFLRIPLISTSHHFLPNLSIKCSSMVSLAAFCPGDPGSNSCSFAVSNSNQKLSFHENYKPVVIYKVHPAMGDTLVGGDK